MKSLIEPIVAQVKAGSKTARMYAEEALARAEAATEYNAIISVIRERALERADAIDVAVKNGEEVGSLAGVPFIAKDMFLTFGSKTTAASNMLRDFEAPYQSTVIEKLEAAGAICIAKASQDAFAHGSSNENSDFGPVKNPHDKTKVPGGSSGGSAAVIALDIVPFALGTDTGGSIRLPASFCGVVGLKPTYGLVSRFGVVAMASSVDTIGAFTKHPSDLARVLDVIAGRDEYDATTIERTEVSYNLESEKVEPLKVGVIKEYMDERVDPAVRSIIERQIEALKSQGHQVETVDIPEVKTALAIYYVVIPAEISSNLARYDGIKYGHHSNTATNLKEVYGKSRTEGFNDENKRRIMIGNYVLSSGYYDVYYKKAQQARTLLIRAFDKAFTSYDVLLGPVAPTPAFDLGSHEDPLAMYLTDIMTISANLVGIPALSVPAGKVNHLPVGLQLMGKRGDDKLLLTVAEQVKELENV